ncbi:MAG: outer membrane protein [Hyphomicrobiaceae bacterium]
MRAYIKNGIAAASIGALLATPTVAGADGLRDFVGGPDSRNCYARADVVGSFYRDPDATYAGPLPLGGVAPRGAVTDEDLDSGFGFDIGFGCGWTRGFRGSIKDDVIERPGGLRADVTYTLRSDADFQGVPPNAPPVDPITTDISSHTVMVNGYWDFGRMSHFQPYVGAGIGLAYVDMDDVTIVNGVDVTFAGNSQWNFAWQVMAGVGIALSERATLDIGYRFVSLGDVDTNAAAFQGGAAVGTSILEIDDIYAHEVKVGIRMSLDGLM